MKRNIFIPNLDDGSITNKDMSNVFHYLNLLIQF